MIFPFTTKIRFSENLMITSLFDGGLQLINELAINTDWNLYLYIYYIYILYFKNGGFPFFLLKIIFLINIAYQIVPSDFEIICLIKNLNIFIYVHTNCVLKNDSI